MKSRTVLTLSGTIGPTAKPWWIMELVPTGVKSSKGLYCRLRKICGYSEMAENGVWARTVPSATEVLSTFRAICPPAPGRLSTMPALRL